MDNNHNIPNYENWDAVSQETFKNIKSIMETFSRFKLSPKEEKLAQKSFYKNEFSKIADEFFMSQFDDKKEYSETLILNLFGGPGCGKSTTAAKLFYELKQRNINCELVPEFCKDLVWEERHETFKDQIYIFGKQYHRIKRLLGKVDVVITDSPILLTPIYDAEQRETLKQLAIEEHNKMLTFNVFLIRKKIFNSKGRVQNESESRDLDVKIESFLNTYNIPFDKIDITSDGMDIILKKLLTRLKWE